VSLNRDSLFSNIVTVFPKGLMNTSTSATLMNGNVFARRIDNMVPSFQTAGAGRVRFGFGKKGSAIGAGTIQEIMEFRKSDGTIQILAYTSDGKLHLLDESLGTYTAVKTGLNTSGHIRFTQFNELLIIVNGYDTPFSWDGTTCTDLAQYLSDYKAGNPAGYGLATNAIQTSVSTLTLQPGTDSNNLDADGVAQPRGAQDYPTGRNIKVYFTGYTQDTTSSTFLWVSTNTITMKPGTSIGAKNYDPGTFIKVTFTSGGVRSAEVYTSTYDNITDTLTLTVVANSFPSTTDTITQVDYSADTTITATVFSTSYNSTTNVLTITVNGTPFPSSTQTITQLKYEVSPPAFSDIYAENNRLWALSGGALSPTDFRGDKGMYVYFTYDVGNENNWYSPYTQNLAYLDLSYKSDKFDELLKVASYNGNMVFCGRQQTFIYAGTDPTTAGAFAWQKTIPIGLLHGDLVQTFPNDLLLVTPYGARSLSTIMVTGNIQVRHDIGSDIDATFNEKAITLQVDATQYAKTRSFFYDKNGFYGFKLDDEALLVYGLSENAKGWVFFTGLPAQATAYMALSDGRLMIGYGDQLYAYGNGTDADVGSVYTDDGETFKARWWTSWKFNPNKRWRNNRWQLIMEESANIDVVVKRIKDWDSGQQTTKTITTEKNGPFWRKAFWRVDTWKISNKLIYQIRDNFISSAFSFIMEIDVSTGPISVLGLKAIGG